MKRKLKKIIIFILIISSLIVEFYVGLYFVNNSKTLNNKDIQKVQTSGFVELEGKEFDEETLVSIDIQGNLLMFLNFRSTTDDLYVLELWDLTKNKQVANLTLNNTKLDQIFGAKFINENQIIIYDEWEEKSEVYDLNLQYIGEDKYQREVEMQNKLESDVFENINNTFFARESYASRNVEDYQAIVFYNDEENTYFQKDPANLTSIYSKDKKIFYCEEAEEKIKFYVRDYDVLKITNKAEIEVKTYSEWSKIPFPFVANDKYLCVPIGNEEGNLENIYFWNYTLNTINVPFEVEKMSTEEIENENQKLVDKIKKDYDINVYLNEEQDDGFIKGIEKDRLQSTIFLTLKELDETLNLFPQNMFKEMYEEQFEGFDIYVVGEIIESDADSNIDAYASNLNDRVYIVYETNLITQDTIVHELMHTAEYRIWNYVPDFDEQWYKLNPNDFEYDQENYDDEIISQYFKRDYGTKSILEDRAVTFEGMFSASAGNIKNTSWMESKQILKKAELLSKVLRQSYPSVQNSENIIWEKCLNN